MYVRHVDPVVLGFGRDFDVTFNDFTKDVVLYTPTSRFVAWFGTYITPLT